MAPKDLAIELPLTAQPEGWKCLLMDCPGQQACILGQPLLSNAESLPTSVSFKRQKSLFERDFQQAVNGIGPLAEVGHLHEIA